MPRETNRRASRDGRPEHPTHLAPGPPRETSAHATPCRKTPYARRKTRTPRPGGQGVHSEPVGEPLARRPLEVARVHAIRFSCGSSDPKRRCEARLRPQQLPFNIHQKQWGCMATYPAQGTDAGHLSVRQADQSGQSSCKDRRECNESSGP